MLRYPARLEPCDEGRVRVILPDVPEVAIVADSEEEALAGAPAALDEALSAYVLDSRPIPSPSDVCGAPMVETSRFSLLGIEATPDDG